MKPKFEKDEMVEAELFKGYFMECRVEDYRKGVYFLESNAFGNGMRILAALPSKYIKKLGERK